jgi:hypothetical protein
MTEVHPQQNKAAKAIALAALHDNDNSLVTDRRRPDDDPAERPAHL